MRWSEFVAACPQIAEVAEARFRADQLVFLGTMRPDAYMRFGDGGVARTWDPAQGLRERPLN